MRTMRCSTAESAGATRSLASGIGEPDIDAAPVVVGVVAAHEPSRD